MKNYLSNSFPLDIFGEKYQIEREIASKEEKKTLLAKDIERDVLVVIKLLIFNNNFSWDNLKFFEREAQTLKSLSHPAIPNYLDYLEIDTDDIKGFALVQSYIPASSLAEQMKSGRTFSEEEVKEIAIAILEILEYLHSRQPLVIHRDIKPSNILLGERSGNSVGQVYLIDFGSVQNVVTKNSSTITVVGTYGYMPPEQFGGRVKPASDLYSLGATLICLVTGKHPADLPETDLKLEFEEFCNLSPGFTNWLKQITNPSLSSRLSPATKALEDLANCENYQSEQTRRFVCPPKSKIFIQQNPSSLKIILPGKKIQWERHNSTVGILLFCCLPLFIALLALLMGMPVQNILEGLLENFGIVAIASIAGATLCYRILEPLFVTKKLDINSSTVFFVHQLFNSPQDYIFTRPTNTIEKIEKNIVHSLDRISSSLNIYLNTDKFEITNNKDFPVTAQDIDWLAEELGIWLNIPVTEISLDERATKRVEVYMRKAYDFHTKGNYKQAIEFYDLVLQLDPKFYRAYLNRGSLYLYLGNYQGAIEDSYMTLDIYPNNVEAYYTRGAAFYYLEDYRSAKKDLCHALEIDPKYQQVYYYLAAVEIALENYQAAIENCDRVLKINPKYSYGYLIKAKACMELNDYRGAIENCDRALEINRKLFGAYSTMGFAYCYSGNNEKALYNFAAKTQLDPTTMDYYNLGATQLFLEIYSDAWENFSSCLKLDDKCKFAYYACAIIHYELGNLELALEDFQIGTELEEIVEDKEHLEDEHAYYIRGLARYQIENNVIEATKDLERAKDISIKHQYKALEEKAIAFIDLINNK